MLAKRTSIGLVHATMNSVQPILHAFQTIHPEVELVNVMDESLIVELNETNNITPHMIRRLIDLSGKVEDADVDGILFTCSSFTPYIPGIKHLFHVPTLSADESMLYQAVDAGKQIGVIATVGKAGPTTTNLLYKIAKEKNKQIEVETKITTEAFYALQKGNHTKHDKIIHDHIDQLAPECDVIILAQFSMARALSTCEAKKVPILTSPESSCRAIVDLVLSQ